MSEVSPRALAVQGAGFGPLPFAVLGVTSIVPAGHNLNTRAIAVQGIGFDARVTALQGFWPPADVEDDDTPIYFPPKRKKKAKRHDTDDDVLLFLLK